MGNKNQLMFDDCRIWCSGDFTSLPYMGMGFYTCELIVFDVITVKGLVVKMGVKYEMIRNVFYLLRLRVNVAILMSL